MDFNNRFTFNCILDCFKPFDKELLERLEQIEDERLTEEFVNDVEKFSDLIMNFARNTYLFFEEYDGEIAEEELRKRVKKLLREIKELDP